VWLPFVVRNVDDVLPAIYCIIPMIPSGLDGATFHAVPMTRFRELCTLCCGIVAKLALVAMLNRVIGRGHSMPVSDKISIRETSSAVSFCQYFTMCSIAGTMCCFWVLTKSCDLLTALTSDDPIVFRVKNNNDNISQRVSRRPLGCASS
jgi:hypothetical protein